MYGLTVVSASSTFGVSTLRFQSEPLLPLVEAAKLLPGNKGKHLHYETLRRWGKVGVRGVRLETKPLGGKKVTSPQAIDRFMDRLAAAEALDEEMDQITAADMAQEQLIRNRKAF